MDSFADPILSILLILSKGVSRIQPPATHRLPSLWAQRPLVAMLEQQPPFDLGDLSAEFSARRTAPRHRFAQIDEAHGVPSRLLHQESSRRLAGRLAGQFVCRRAESREDRVVSDSLEPVFRIGEIGLAAMHDSVPVAATGRGQSLADAVRLVEKIVDQPQARQAAAGHFAIGRDAAAEQAILVQLLKPRPESLLGRSGAERAKQVHG